ncbi:hypothetical protein [Winogradskyella alexanderae]|uniref:Uncharacterized protein n=1 Tax=Winogradskyella alexanderae TaxID=2877123 RepID=A0ABS7XNQ1_9FLAO|nr:hypothetical protein [Winogradskyella alexanderae]MCA0131129.1 hypothetical protein [Winogradskyella alexanderae]
MLDNFYIAILKYYKTGFRRKSLTIALFYINFLELAILLLLGTFFLAFAKQMKLATMSSTKFWWLFILVSVFVVFKNWMRYNGKKRNVLGVKTKGKLMSIYLLWILPFASLILAFILYQVQ